MEQQTEQINKSTEKEHECYLNITFKFSKNQTTQEREKAFKRVIKRLKIHAGEILRNFLDQDELTLSYILCTKQPHRHYKEFKMSNIEIAAFISSSNTGLDTYSIEELTLTNKDTDEEEIIYCCEEDLLTNLKLLAKEEKIDTFDFMQICKGIIKKGPNQYKGPNNEFACFELNQLDLEKNYGKSIGEITQIQKNIENFLSTFRHCYSVDGAQQKRPILSVDINLQPKKEFKNFTSSDFDCYLKVYGEISSDPSTEVVTELGTNKTIYKFTIQDDLGNRLWIKTEEEIEFYHILNPIFKSKVEIFGFLRIVKGYPQFQMDYMKIIEYGIKITRYMYKRMGKKEYYFENENTGLFNRGYDKDGDLCFEQRYTEKPVQITGYFINTEKVELFGLKIGRIEYFGSIQQILEDLKTGRQNEIVWFENLDEAMKNIIREIIRGQTPVKVHSWSGVYVDDNNNFEIVIPQTHKIIPENYIQHRIIEYMKKCKIIVPKDEIDENSGKRYNLEELAEIKKSLTSYYNIWMFPGIQNIHKIVTFGHSVSTVFFKCLSIDKSIDVYPAHFAIGPKGAGKTSLFRLLCEFFYCVPEWKGNDINSESRLKDILSGSTWLQLIDEIDAISKSKYKDQIIIFLKAALTSMADTGRKTASQQWLMTQMNCTIAGTANTIQWLNDDSAFKEGRSILSTYAKGNHRMRKPFQDMEKIIKNPKFTRIGFFFTRESIEFIRTWSKNNPIEGVQCENDLNALIRLIESKKDVVQRICDRFNIRLSDNRRNTINALILVGLEFWRWVFCQYLDGTRIDLLEEYLREDSQDLANFILKFEKANYDSKLEEVFQLISFIESKYNFNDVDCQILVDRDKNIIHLSNQFLAQYNEYAQKTGFRKYRDLPDLAAMLNELTNDIEIDPNKRVQWPSKRQQRVVQIHYKALLGEDIPEVSDKKEIFAFGNELPLPVNNEKKPTIILKKMKELMIENDDLLEFDDILTAAAPEGFESESVRFTLEKLVHDKKVEQIGENHFRLKIK